MELLRTQKNELLRLIVELDLNPDEFDLMQQKHSFEHFPFLLHKPSSHSLLFEKDSRGLFVLSGTPGTHTHEFRHDEILPDDWETQRKYAFIWLNNLKRELATPDLWEIFSQKKVFLNAMFSAEIENSPFSSDEQLIISNRLEALKGVLLTHQSISTELRHQVRDGLEYLKELSKSAGRRHWFMAALMIYPIIASLGVPPEIQFGVFEMIKEFLNQFLPHLPTLGLPKLE